MSGFQPSSRLNTLLARGVRMPHPASVHIDDTIVPERIAADVTIHPGCRLSGATTSVGPGSVLGAEAPLTLEDSQLGANVELKGGFVSGAVLLDGANLGSGAHVRPGTLLEEEAGGAHTVGLKQTILMPYVTLGSLINFCDILMAGGTSRKNHSEVGSSFIHFNFTPHQDKATASLIGDVPRGVFLDQPPVFLGGQGGLVGPVRVGFGCVTPAGSVWRGDAPGDGLLLRSPDVAPGTRPYQLGAYRGAMRIWRNNVEYLGNLHALCAWYRHVRIHFMTGIYAQFCLEGAMRQLDAARAERMKRLEEWLRKLKHSADLLRAREDAASQAERAAQRQLLERGPSALERLREAGDAPAEREAFLAALREAGPGGSYLERMPALPDAAKGLGVAWLRGVVEHAVRAGAMD